MSSRNLIRTFAASALALALVSTGATASADQTVVVAGEGDGEVDGGWDGPNPFLFNAGLITTALSYTPALIVAVNSDRSEDKYLYAPFVGPWLDLAARDDDEKVQRTLLVVDGVFQTLGALQLLASFMFIGDDDADVVGADSSGVIQEAAVAPARLPGDGYGLVAVGRF